MDILLERGVDRLGYGEIYKVVMCDPTLPLTAKALYAYFCSYTGAGSAASPSRDKIIKDLHFNKDTFTKYLNALIDAKYIIRKRTRSGNVYEILRIVEGKDGKLVRVKSEGVGTVPKSALLDDRLSVKAKAFYAYLCSYEGAGSESYPKYDTILQELNIGNATYRTCYNQLEELGYITSIRNRTSNGQFSSFTYVLNTSLKPAPASGANPSVDALRKAQRAFQGLAEELGLTDEQDIVDLVKEVRREKAEQ